MDNETIVNLHLVD